MKKLFATFSDFLLRLHFMEAAEKRRFITELVPLITIIIIALFLLPIAGVSVSNNTAKYLHRANKILHNQDQRMLFEDKGIEVDRGPLFPMMVALGFKLMGKSVQSAILITRGFFALGIILTYLLGRVLYDKVVGILCSSFVLTSYGVNRIATSIDTDIVHPFFILLFVLLYYLSLNRLSRRWAVSAGLSLGLAFMVKESAIFCLGLPVGVAIFAATGKRWDYGKLGLWMIGGTLVCMLPLAIQTIVKYSSLMPLLGAAHPQYQQVISTSGGFDSPLLYWCHVFTVGLKNALVGYYQGALQKVTPLSSLMIFGWLFVCIRGFVSKRTNDLVLGISIASFLPLILRVGDGGLRSGQTANVYMLLYVALAIFVASSSGYLVDQLVSHKLIYRKLAVTLSNVLIVSFGILFILLQLFSGGNTWREWTQGRTSLAIFSREPFKVYGRYTIEQQEAADWLKKNTLKGSKIVADGYSHEALDFFGVSKGDIPVFHPKKSVSIALGSIKKRNDNDRPVYLITYHSFDTGSQSRRVMFPIFEEDIITATKKGNPDYIVISARGLFLQAYFNKAKWAELKYENSDVKIYKISSSEIGHVMMEDVCVNDEINYHLKWLKENFPEEYSLLLEKLEELGLSIGELERSQCRFPAGQVY